MFYVFLGSSGLTGTRVFSEPTSLFLTITLAFAWTIFIRLFWSNNGFWKMAKQDHKSIFFSLSLSH